MNPIRTPTKKPPPRVAAVGPKLSILGIILDAAPSDTYFHYTMITLMYPYY